MQAQLRRLALAILVLTCSALAVTSNASAQAPADRWGCEAQPLEASLAGFDLVEALGLLTANPDRTPCADDEAPLDALNDALDVLQPAGISLDAVEADTTITPDTGPATGQAARARANVAGLDVSLLGLASLVAVDAAEATATGSCVNGAVQLAGTSNIGDVRVGGRPVLDLDEPVTIVGNGLNGLLPGTVVQLSPNLETRAGGELSRTALRVTVLQLGATLLALDVSKATVSSAQVSCVEPAPTVVLGDTGINRTLVATVTPAVGRTITSCSFDINGGTIAGTYADGRCTARTDAPVGSYDVTARGTDDAGRTGSATGRITIAAPQVGTPQVADRVVSAPLTPAPGVAITSCTVTVTPAGGSATTLPGTVAGGVCRASVPDAVPAGPARVVATATDANGDTGTAATDSAIGPVPAGPGISIVPSGENRQVLATITGAATSCTLEARPVGSTGAFTALQATLADGRCTAALPAADFPAGQSYEVKATATDANGRKGEATGTQEVERPKVGPATVDGRTVSAPVTAPAGTTITTCVVTLTPAGGTATSIGGSYDAAAAACVATAPDELPRGQYAIDVTATNDDGDTGSSTTNGEVGPVGGSQPPTVVLVADVPNRVVAGEVDVAPDRTVTACAATVVPAAGGAPITVPVRYEGDRCVASLPVGSVPPGEYVVTIVATDSQGESGSVSGPVEVVAPGVGTPVLTGGDVVTPVTPAPGTPLTACLVTITPAGGAATTITGRIEDGKCSATLPAGLPAGPGQVVVTLTDANGDQGTGTGAVTLPGSGGTNPGGNGGGGGGTGTGTGTTTTTPPATPVTPGKTMGEGLGDASRVLDFKTATAAELLLGCAADKLVLFDAVRSGSRVRLAGVAARSLVGRTVTLVFGSGAKQVATTVVKADGTFSTRAPLPSAAARRASTARYQAVLGGAVSRKLKLERRVVVTSFKRAGSRLRMVGRTTAPLARKGTAVVIQRLVACGRYSTVGTVKTDARGRFAASIGKPAAQAALYRVVTRVAKVRGGGAVSRTFSLPTPITLG